MKGHKVEMKEEEWFPSKEEYSPKLSVEEWVGLLNDASVFNESSLQVMKRLKDYGGQATCKELSIKYGETYNFYNKISQDLASRIINRTGCQPPPYESSENSKWWPVLYVGKRAGKDIKGVYIWKLRDELSEALDRVDLSGVALYANAKAAEAVRNENPLQKPSIGKKYTKEDFLSEVFMTEKKYDELKALLQNKLNVILQGPPGAGKTFMAKKLAYSMMGEMDDSRIEMVQFHQNYSYEDFIMGYRPDGSDFKLTDGIFYRFCQKAANYPDKEYFFIIDEINRGNLSKILGELMMLIEKDYRETKATMAYSGMPFSVPKNLYIIGMMNTADRSLAMIDYALRRRFSFFEVEPGFDSDGFMHYQKAFGNETFDALIAQIKMLNEVIVEDKSLGRGFQIGHSYFCGRKEDECTEEWMKSVVKFDILPMLREYWFDEPGNLSQWEKNLCGVFHDER